MGDTIVRHCGPFAIPQLVVSLITVALLAAYLVSLRRHEVPLGQTPWTRTLEPLAGISMAIGLLGSVAGFIVAFGGFDNGLDVQRITRGLAGAYWTTAVGIVSALVASCGSYVLTVLHKPESQ